MAGVGRPSTVTVATAELVQPNALVPVTVYWPDILNWAFAMVGFCKLLLYALGPDHVYVVAPFDVKLMFWFRHTVWPAVVTLGNGFTTTGVVVVLVQLLAPVTVSVYVPALVFWATAMVGFCWLLV